MKYFIFSLFLLSCTGNFAQDSELQPASNTQGLAIATSDYESGELLLVWPGQQIVRVPIHADAKLYVPELRKTDLVVIGRQHRDSLLFVDKLSGEIRGEHSVGLGSNAQNALFVTPEIVYVTRYIKKSLWLGRVDVSAKLIESKETAEFAGFAEGSDGLSEVYGLGKFGDYVLVSIQNLSDSTFLPTGQSRVVVLDVKDPWNPKEVSSLKLQCQNPLTDFVKVREVAGGTLFAIGSAGEMGYSSKLDGCIEGLTLGEGGAITHHNVIITEKSLGGDLINFYLNDKGGVALVANSKTTSAVVSFDVGLGLLGKNIKTFDGRGSDLINLGEFPLLSIADKVNPRLELLDPDGKSLALPFTLPRDLLPPQQVISLGHRP